MPKRAIFQPTRKGTTALPWRINIPAALSESGRRERRLFATKQEAATFADQQKIRIQNFGTETNGLTPSQREAAAAAFRLLGSAPAPQLVAIVQEHLKRKRELAASVSLRELQKEFTAAKSKRSAPYLRQLRQAFSKLSDLSSRKISGIGFREIDEALKGLADTNRNLHIRVLRAAFNFAAKKRWVSENPVDDLFLSEQRKKEVEVLTAKEAARLLVACRRFEPELLPYHLFGLFAGVRPEELLRMRWEFVALDDKHIILPGEVTKTGRRRVIEMEPALVSWLEWFFSKHGPQSGKVTPSPNLRKRLRRIRSKAKISHWIQDVMRHTYASNWLAKIGDIDRLLLNLGHYSTAVLWRHYHSAVPRKDAEKFWALIPKSREKKITGST